MAGVLSELSGEPAPDPDAHATLTDFIDYTDFFPSDLKRSLTLIGQLNVAAQDDYDSIHHLTRIYGALPTLPAEERQDPETLRRDISFSLDHALRARELAHAEASRLCNIADNLNAKLVTIHRKLVALPKPPSRDSTPIPQARSPLASRGRKAENERAPRITLFSDVVKVSHRDGARPKHRSRRIIVPGEVLPPVDPNSPGVDYTDSESDKAPSPPPMPVRIEKVLKQKTPRPPKPVTMKIPKQAGGVMAVNRPPKEIPPPGLIGTNAHSTVAGISVSNAMALLDPPPPNPEPGSKHAPWHTLTEWELNKLRKRMKKNAAWMPSTTMIRRELAGSGRGTENYNQAKARAAASGGEVLDEPAANPITVPLLAQEALDGDHDEKISNRGMKLNAAKKIKKETLARELAAAQDAARLEEADRRIKDAEIAHNNLFSRSTSDIMIDPILLNASPPVPIVEAKKPAKKRKRDVDVAPSGELLTISPKYPHNATPKLKKVKLAHPSTVGASTPNLLKTISDQIVVPVSPVRAARVMPDTTITIETLPITASTLPSPSKLPELLSPVIQPAPDIKPETATFKVPSPPSKDIPLTPTASTPAAESPQAQPGTEEVMAAPIIKRPTRAKAPIISLTLSSPKKAASAEPPVRRTSLRRGSNASMPNSHAVKDGADRIEDLPLTRSSRHGKRPTPGLVTTHKDEGGVTVSVSDPRRRAAAPTRSTKKTAAVGSKKSTRLSGPPTPVVVPEEEYQDDEPRYCYCNDISHGTMVACEAQDCEREWFHLACVGLEEIPARRQKWFCPDCRVRLGVTEYGQKV